MDAERAKQLFKQADELYLNQQYKEALVILAELNQAYPNQKNVLWPSALCLSKVGRHAEAIKLCDALTQYFDDDRAADLKQRIQVHVDARTDSQKLAARPFDAMEGKVNLDDIDALIDRPAAQPVRVPREAAPDYKKWALIAGGALVVLMLVALPFLGGGPSNNSIAPIDAASIDAAGFDTSQIDTSDLSPEDAEMVRNFATVAGTGAAAGRLIVVLVFLSFFFAQVLAMYCTLSLVQKLPSTDFSENIQDVLLYSIIFTLLSVVPIAGFIATLVIMSRHYQLSCGELLITWIVITVLTAGFIIVGMFVVGGSFAGIMQAV